MTFKEALQLIESKKDIIGTIDEKGLLIDLLLVVPTENNKRDDFVRSLMSSRNPQQSFLPFVNEDVEVWATNADYLYEKGILFYRVLESE